VKTVREALANSEPLLLFVVIGLGFLLGQVRARGASLGVAGVLFVGLVIGAWRPEGEAPFVIAPQITQVGLILFVYAVGLTSGPGFFASIRTRGTRFNLAMLVALLSGATLALVLGRWLELPPGQIAGIFCGGLTNTPALAAVSEMMRSNAIGDPADPAAAYSIAYPYGVVGGLLAFQVFAWAYRKPAAAERAEAQARAAEFSKPTSANFRVTNPALFDKAIGELEVRNKTGLTLSRVRHRGYTRVPTKYTRLREADLVVAVGAEPAIAKGAEFFGEKTDEHLERAFEEVCMRRVLVSRKKLVGRTIGSLALDRAFNAQITRLRRADLDMVPTPNMALEMGDRVRVVMPIGKESEIAKFFGDSERDASEVDYVALTLGITCGVLLGLVPIPVPGGASVSLGFAGGPLVAGLILGHRGRTGPVVWSLPYESSQTLRHIGLLFFLAGVGVMAGGRFLDALSTRGPQLVGLGFLVTTVTTALTLLLLRHAGKATVISAIGATSGMQTQPATLARAYEMSQSEETYVAYATTYPVAMVGKILIAQGLVLVSNCLG
jgi:putative transport protein